MAIFFSSLITHHAPPPGGRIFVLRDGRRHSHRTPPTSTTMYRDVTQRVAGQTTQDTKFYEPSQKHDVSATPPARQKGQVLVQAQKSVPDTTPLSPRSLPYQE